MTPTKEKQKNKNRPATVVFQRMTPELMLAYRIFSPGLGDEEGLNFLKVQMDRIINDVCVSRETVVEDGKEVQKNVGMLEDLKSQMKVTQEQIQEAYDAYKAEIERMMKEDQAYLVAKARGEVGEGNNEKRGTKRKSSGNSSTSAKRVASKSPSSRASVERVQRRSSSSSAEASTATRKVSIDLGIDDTADDNNINNNNEDEDTQDDSEEDDDIYMHDDDLDDDDLDDEDLDDEDLDLDLEDEDEGQDLNALYEVPADRWLTKNQALTKVATSQRRIDAMRGTLDLIHDFYKTQMVPRHDLTTRFATALSYMTQLRAYATELHELVEGHDGGEYEGGEVNIWEDDRRAVTVLVPGLIPKCDELPLRLEAMERLMEEVSAIADELVTSAAEPTRKRFRRKLGQLVKQTHTFVPPPYDRVGYGTMAPAAEHRRQDLNSEKSQEESSDQGSSKKNAKTTEVITIDDD